VCNEMATIYQEFLPKAYDIRVTIVGRKLFAVSIDSQSDPSAVIDWRKTEKPLVATCAHRVAGAIAAISHGTDVAVITRLRGDRSGADTRWPLHLLRDQSKRPMALD
jgi:hypothetical protein